MNSGIPEGIGYLSGGVDPHSPPSEGLDISPRRGSSSPGYDSNPDKPTSRKRTNTTSSGSGDKRTANKICRVCGDKAFSYNFNVITCESCKAFFRRNANKEKDIRCPFNENCEINIVSRRFCQRCRLAKCFDVGMKKEWIMTEEARLEKKQRVEENRERRLQDALAKNSDSGSSPMRDRTISDSRMDDGNSQDGFITVRDYVMQSEDLKFTRIHDDISQPLAALPIACHSHPLLDTIPTTAANSVADVSATTSHCHTMDVDPSTTMSGNGFIPPTIENVTVALPTLIPSVAPVDTSLMAQVAAQAVINQQQHQLAAAVVAQQVVAQQVAAQMGVNTPPITTTLPPLPKPVLTPAIATPMLTNPLPTQAPSLLHGIPPPDMVTIPRDILLKLMETNTVRQANCRCTCVCGRYPPGSVIVDEVTKSLLAAGNQNSSCNSCENKEEARLETAEDFQRNGLLPSDDSSVQWLNSSQPTVVDPSTIFDSSVVPENVSMFNVDPYYPNATVLETQMQSITVDPNMWVLTVADKEILAEVENVNQSWKESSIGWSSENYRNGTDYGLITSRMQSMARALGRLTSFRFLNQLDQVALIKKNAILYLALRGVLVCDPKETTVSVPEEWPFSNELFVQCIRLFISLSEPIRRNELALSVLSLLALFDVDASITDRDTVLKCSEKFSDLLRRLLFSYFKQDYSKARAEYRAAVNLLSAARKASVIVNTVIGWEPATTNFNEYCC
ncbi:unnamed protein product [Auanema sp. JU1783]|nr:unnamed protein product [Auanema sp. JU1783]